MVTMISKICPVCKKEFLIEIKRINVGQGIYCSNKCVGKANYKGGRKATYKRHREKHYDKLLAYNLEYSRNYRKTVRGYLILLFHKLKDRCENPEHPSYNYCGSKGIKCLFKSSDEFANYIINELQIDPRGLQIHRIDNNGDYEHGNIEFLTPKEHGSRHRKEGS